MIILHLCWWVVKKWLKLESLMVKLPHPFGMLQQPKLLQTTNTIYFPIGHQCTRYLFYHTALNAPLFHPQINNQGAGADSGTVSPNADLLKVAKHLCSYFLGHPQWVLSVNSFSHPWNCFFHGWVYAIVVPLFIFSPSIPSITKSAFTMRVTILYGNLKHFKSIYIEDATRL